MTYVEICAVFKKPRPSSCRVKVESRSSQDRATYDVENEKYH